MNRPAERVRGYSHAALGVEEAVGCVTKMHHPIVFMQRTLTFETSASCALVTAFRGGLMKNLVVLSAMFFSGLAVAQSLPVFGTAKFGQAVFGGASVGTTSVGTDALPVPFMPLWANITLAVALWALVYLMRSKES